VLNSKLKRKKEQKIMTNTKKLYPFSLVKHGHDIEFRYNRLKNIECDYFDGGTELTPEEFNRLETELEAVTEAYKIILNTHSNGKVVWVDGETLAILKRCVFWADNERANRNRKGA
jgi:hypothetical protein